MTPDPTRAREENMSHRTNCTHCGVAYEETSEDRASEPGRLCWDCSTSKMRNACLACNRWGVDGNGCLMCCCPPERVAQQFSRAAP